jgi:hypothetical protein
LYPVGAYDLLRQLFFTRSAPSHKLVGPPRLERAELDALSGDHRQRLFEVASFRGLFVHRPGRWAERARLGHLEQPGRHRRQVAKQFKCAALLRGRAVVEHGRFELAGEMQQDLDLVLQGPTQFVAGQHHQAISSYLDRPLTRTIRAERYPVCSFCDAFCGSAPQFLRHSAAPSAG